MKDFCLGTKIRILRKKNVYKSKFKCDTIIISRNSSYMCSERWVQRGPRRCCFFFFSLNFLFRSLRASLQWIESHFVALCHFAFLFLFVFSSFQTCFFLAGMKMSNVVLKEGLITREGCLLFMCALTREVLNTHTWNKTSTKLIKQNQAFEFYFLDKMYERK